MSDAITETIKYIIGFIPQLLNGIPFITFIPLDFKIMGLAIILGFWAGRGKRAVEGYLTWIFVTFATYTIIKYWTL